MKPRIAINCLKERLYFAKLHLKNLTIDLKFWKTIKTTDKLEFKIKNCQETIQDYKKGLEILKRSK